MSTPIDTAFAGRYGPWAIVAGASEGTGAAFSELLAAHGLNLLLLARSADKLADLAASLRRAHGVQVLTLSVDLVAPDAAAIMADAAQALDVGLVVFNAGGDHVGGRFLASPYAAWKTLTQRNIDMLTEASHHFAQRLVQRGRGGLLLVGSQAALGGCGRLAVYTATKAYALNFGESLWQELRPLGVDVLNLLIGATDTPKLRRVFAQHQRSPDSVPLTAPVDVARAGLQALGAGPTLVLGEPEHSTDPLSSAAVRRERVEFQSAFLDHFYGQG